jgi:hypothetical protein
MRRSAPPPVLVALAALALAGCDPHPPPPAPAPASVPGPPAASPQAGRFTPADFRRLRWIEGTWRGSGVNQAAFYERYRFADDSTLIVDSFPDSTLATVSESTRFELRGGTLANASATARWVASRLDDRSVDFVPAVGVRNTFTWRYESADRWTALLRWPASDTRPARDATYHMVRIR